jgi:hypothetical protein
VSGEVSQRQLVGPDSVGYTNAVSALLSRGSFSDLEDAAIAAAEVQNTTELFRNDQVYQIADKGLSVSTEFIVGAYRIGFPSLAATVTGFLGPQHLLSAMYTTVALYISLGVILMFWLIKSTAYHQELHSWLQLSPLSTSISLLDFTKEVWCRALSTLLLARF